MDCETARNLFAFRRPGANSSELSPEDQSAVERHLAECPTCAVIARRYDAFDASVSTVMTAVPLPPGLRDRLIHLTTKRRAIRMRRRVLSGLAVAASLLIVILLGFGVRRATQPILHPEEFARQQDQAAERPDQTVAEWLRRQHIPAELPIDVDFRHYAFHGVQSVAGRDVPVIVFQAWRPNASRPDTLKLFLFRTSEFRFQELQPAASSLFSAQVVADDRQNSGVLYLALFNTPDLTPFLLQPTIPTPS